MKRMWSKNELKNQIDSRIQSGQVDNAKPLYFHPLTIELTGDTCDIRLCAFIINNDSTAFTKETFEAYMNNFVGRLLLTGAVNDKVNNQITIATLLRIASSVAFLIYGMTPNGAVVDTNNNAVNLLSYNYTLIDDVNKIN